MSNTLQTSVLIGWPDEYYGWRIPARSPLRSNLIQITIIKWWTVIRYLPTNMHTMCKHHRVGCIANHMRCTHMNENVKHICWKRKKQRAYYLLLQPITGSRRRHLMFLIFVISTPHCAPGDKFNSGIHIDVSILHFTPSFEYKKILHLVHDSTCS